MGTGGGQGCAVQSELAHFANSVGLLWSRPSLEGGERAGQLGSVSGPGCPPLSCPVSGQGMVGAGEVSPRPGAAFPPALSLLMPLVN